ncbi:putative adenine-specific methylase [Spirochaetia bacterium]|nr:putative adenine-specific methylase [Spirochaetia bacterium]
MANSNLTSAKNAKNDEFYTQWADIEREVNAYLEFNPNVFRDRVVLCPCDDPEWSNFTKFFALHFSDFGLKKLISTSFAADSNEYNSNYQPTLFETESPKFDKDKTRKYGKIFVLERTADNKHKAKINIDDLEWDYLPNDGDFRSIEVSKLREEVDIIVTNPPFSLFREFIKWIMDEQKWFLIIGNLNAITYKEVFPLIKKNKVWLGNNCQVNGGAMFYEIPEGIANMEQVREVRTDENGKKRYITRVQGVRWFTNLEHGRRHEPISLMTEKDVVKFGTKKSFNKYDNYDAIEVPLVKHIPSDYEGVIGVPISFLDKYCPDQFEILGTTDNGLVDDKFKKTPGLTKEFVNDYYKAGGTGAYKEGNPTAGYYENGVAKMAYKRILIKAKKEATQ